MAAHVSSRICKLAAHIPARCRAAAVRHQEDCKSRGPSRTPPKPRLKTSLPRSVDVTSVIIVPKRAPKLPRSQSAGERDSYNRGCHDPKYKNHRRCGGRAIGRYLLP